MKNDSNAGSGCPDTTCSRSSQVKFVVESRRADLGGEWKQVGNVYTTLKRAEKEARWERSSRKGKQARIVIISANVQGASQSPDQKS